MEFFQDRLRPTLAVFSHPNHEMAVYGVLQRLRPALVFLTDGGGEARIEQTKQGLMKIGLHHRALFLDYTEQSFYRAILNRDTEFFRGVIAKVRKAVEILTPAQVLCDAVEFYNPVHDIAMPVALAAYGNGESVFEIPLVYQVAGEGPEQYAIQRVPPECWNQQVFVSLTDDELKMKRDAFDSVYSILKDVVMNGLRCAPDDVVRQESLVHARYPLRSPEPTCAIRYDWRAKKLLAEGKVKEAITHEGHYVPLVESLLLT